jgi:hypothetical protein
VEDPADNEVMAKAKRPAGPREIPDGWVRLDGLGDGVIPDDARIPIKYVFILRRRQRFIQQDTGWLRERDWPSDLLVDPRTVGVTEEFNIVCAMPPDVLQQFIAEIHKQQAPASVTT